MSKPKKLTLNDLKSVLAGANQEAAGKTNGQEWGKKKSEYNGKIRCLEGAPLADDGSSCDAPANSGSNTRSNNVKKK